MTEIDAANFKPQGKPTVEQVRTVWDAMPDPTARKVADLMVQRGWKISFRSVARYKESGWVARKATVAKVKEVKNAVAKKVEAVAPQGIEAAVAPRINFRTLEERMAIIAELVGKPEAELMALESKMRRVYNIVLLQESAARSDVLALIPKDSAMMVQAQTEAQSAGVAPMMPPDGTDTKPDGVLELEANPVASAITTFLEKEGMAA